MASMLPLAALLSTVVLYAQNISTDNLMKSGTAAVSVTIKHGWNLVSIPIYADVVDSDKYPLPVSDQDIEMDSLGMFEAMYTYHSKEWEKNPMKIEAREGFWLKNPGDEYSLSFDGYQYEIYTSSLPPAQWSLIGNGQIIQEFDMADNSIEIMWIYHNQQWEKNPTKLSPGQGIWVYLK